jgi:hypothetical protein
MCTRVRQVDAGLIAPKDQIVTHQTFVQCSFLQSVLLS